MSDQFFDGFLDDYFAECEEHLTSARAGLLELESSAGHSAGQRRVVDDLFRSFHSLKGISAMVDLRPAERLAHEVETLLRSIRAGDQRVTPDVVTVLIEATDRLERVVAGFRSRGTLPGIEDVIQRLSAAVTGSADAAARGTDSVPSEGRLWKCAFAPTRELLAQGVGVDAVRRQLSSLGTIIEASPQIKPDSTIAFEFVVQTTADVDLVQALEDSPIDVEPVRAGGAAASAAPSADEPEVVPGVGSPSQMVRVDLTRLDELMRYVGDLVISRARLLDTLARIEPHVPPADWRAVQDDAAAIERQVRTLREGLMRVRLVPIGEIFRRMPFVVRDLARDTGKRVTLLLRGQTTEIDKYLIERMMDPVLHLVRNAVSHGIESPDDRVAAGKRPEGTITLSASAAGDLVTLEIADDGRGVDSEAVVARARQAGLPVPPGPIDPATVLSLLCSPGFSTRDDADRASGRGVGMAVVKETVEKLSGTIALHSEPGTGTRFVIQLPLTLAIADALLARVGTESFAVPQSMVREIVEIDVAGVRRFEENEIVPYRDGALSMVRLSRLFGIDAPLPARFHVLVFGTGSAAVGFAVDRVAGQREIVVRSITDPLVRVDGVSGATDLGDGRAVLILDLSALARFTRQRGPRVLTGTAQWGRLRA